ncbi:MAG: hypothetical protein R3F59_38030 [Myxococcota bacterium]
MPKSKKQSSSSSSATKPYDRPSQSSSSSQGVGQSNSSLQDELSSSQQDSSQSSLQLAALFQGDSDWSQQDSPMSNLSWAGDDDEFDDNDSSSTSETDFTPVDQDDFEDAYVPTNGDQFEALEDGRSCFAKQRVQDVNSIPLDQTAPPRSEEAIAAAKTWAEKLAKNANVTKATIMLRNYTKDPKHAFAPMVQKGTQDLHNYFKKMEAPLKLDQEQVRTFGQTPIKEGSVQAGFVPEKHEELSFQGISRSGQRSSQMLTHFSRVVRRACWDSRHKDPVEVQFGYTLRGKDDVTLYASANCLKDAKWMAEQLRDPGALLSQALAPPGPKRDGFDEQAIRAAERITRWKDGGRKERLKADEREDDHDVALANRLWELFTNGEVTVVCNDEKKGRHAEQNIATQMYEDVGRDRDDGDAVYVDIQGTKFRC